MKEFKEIYRLFLLMSKNGEENAIVLQYTNGWRILFFTIMTWYSTLLMFCHMMLYLIPSNLFVFSLYIIWCVLSFSMTTKERIFIFCLHHCSFKPSTDYGLRQWKIRFLCTCIIFFLVSDILYFIVILTQEHLYLILSLCI